MDSSVRPFKPLTREEVAAVLEVSLRTVDAWAASGLLPPKAAIAGKVFWHPEIFYGWLDAVLRPDALERREVSAPTLLSAATRQTDDTSDENRVEKLNAEAAATANGGRKTTRKLRRNTSPFDADLDGTLQARDRAALRRILG